MGNAYLSNSLKFRINILYPEDKSNFLFCLKNGITSVEPNNVQVNVDCWVGALKFFEESH